MLEEKEGASRGGLKALVAETAGDEIARREPWGHALLHPEVRGGFYNTLLLTLLSLFPEGWEPLPFRKGVTMVPAGKVRAAFTLEI